MRSFPIIALLAGLAALGCKAPAPAEAPGAIDPAMLEARIITPMPTRAQPQILEGTLTMGTPAPGDRGERASIKVYRLSVPPGARLKAELKAAGRSFEVAFLSASMGRIPDPGLNLNRINKRPDLAFYENRTDAPMTIFCAVRGLEMMDRRPYTLALTDF